MSDTKQFKRTLITSALPYANGPVHIGHLAGVYVPADIYARYKRSIGEEVLYIGGSDEHGVPISLKAKKEGCTPREIVDRYHQLIKESFEKFGISFDIYSRTSSEIHHKTASEFFRTLYDNGKFIEQTTQQYYDPKAKMFLADRYIVGTCPKCGNENAYGDQCEACGSSLNATDLINPHSVVSGATLEMRDTKHWYLPLNDYEEWLKHWILDTHKEWKHNVYGQCKSWLDAGLQPRAVSRDLDWGVPVPIEGNEGKVLYVWFDAPIGYISNTKELLPESWETWWKDPSTRLIHFIGKDNIVFHCIVFPTMLKAEGSYILPDNVPANEFLNLEGNKISTSRNWAVWLHEYLEDFPGKQDVLRYVLTANAPETKDNDFTWFDFQARNNNELVAILGNFVNRSLVLTHKYFQGKVPAAANWDSYDSETVAKLDEIIPLINTHIEQFRFRDALREVMNIARLGNKYLADTEPWKVYKTDIERVRTILNISLQITANIAIAIAPFLPFSSDKLFAMLNLPQLNWKHLGSTSLLNDEHQLAEPQLLFEKIEDEAIAKQMERLSRIAEQNKAEQASAPELKKACKFDDFVATDLRVGLVTACERVPKSDKLLKLTIDDGMGGRTILSGIAKSYRPEQLVGKKLTFIANLPPRKMMGTESQGMVLCAEDFRTGELKVLFVDDNLSPGSTIS